MSYLVIYNKTAAQLTADNQILLPNQIGMESDTLLTKIGDGQLAWNSLYYDTPVKGAFEQTLSALTYRVPSSYAVTLAIAAAGAAIPLTATYVGFGSGANVLTGSANLVWTGIQLTVAGTVSSAGYQISGAATSGTILRGNGASYVASTATYPNTIASGYVPYATGANAIGSSINMTFDGNSLTVGTSVISPIYQGSTSASGSITIRATSSATDGNILFYTDNTTERARILSTGEFLVGTTTLLISTDVSNFFKNQNGGSLLWVLNNTSGTAARAGLLASSNNGTTVISATALSAAYTTSGINVANTGVLQSNLAAGLNVGTSSNTQMSFWTNSTKKISIPAAGGLVIGTAALATTATDGFLYIPTCAGPPTGVPTVQTGTVAMIFDTTNKKLYIYSGSWIGGTVPGVFS